MLYVALAGQLILVACAYMLETRSRSREGAATVRRSIRWSCVWLALGLLPTVAFGALRSGHAASSYAAVYLIERALSLDNVFVFAVLIAAFEIPPADREHLVSSGAFAAFALRVPAILGGVALFESSHLVGYALGALLLVLAWQTARSGAEESHGPSRLIDWLRRRLPVSEEGGWHWTVRLDGRRQITPMLLCLIAIMVADVAFAVDSIPAALAISHDATLLLTANLLALLGLRALYELVIIARERLLYMDQTIAVLLALVGLKLLGASLLHVDPIASLVSVIVVLAAGAAVSLRASASRST